MAQDRKSLAACRTLCLPSLGQRYCGWSSIFSLRQVGLGQFVNGHFRLADAKQRGRAAVECRQSLLAGCAFLA